MPCSRARREVAAVSLQGAPGVPARGRGRAHPPAMRRPDAAGTSPRRRLPSCARAAGLRSPPAGVRPAIRHWLGAARRLAPDCAPIVAYGGLIPQRLLDVPAARLGQPALLAAAGVAWSRARAARPVARGRRDRGDHLRPGRWHGHRSRVRHGHRVRAARRTRPATCSTDWPSSAPDCWSPPSMPSRTASRSRSRSAGSPASPRS